MQRFHPCCHFCCRFKSNRIILGGGFSDQRIKSLISSFKSTNLSHWLQVSVESFTSCSIHQVSVPKTCPSPSVPCNLNLVSHQRLAGQLLLKHQHAGRWFISYEWKTQMKAHSCLGSERKQLGVWWAHVRRLCLTYTGELSNIRRRVKRRWNTWLRRKSTRGPEADVLWRSCSTSRGCTSSEHEARTKGIRTQRQYLLHQLTEYFLV